jgi:hypothetical protein
MEVLEENEPRQYSLFFHPAIIGSVLNIFATSYGWHRILREHEETLEKQSSVQTALAWNVRGSLSGTSFPLPPLPFHMSRY